MIVAGSTFDFVNLVASWCIIYHVISVSILYPPLSFPRVPPVLSPPVATIKSPPQPAAAAAAAAASQCSATSATHSV